MRTILVPLLAVMLSGCVSAATAIITAPVKVASAGVDALTTSQSEADRNRGRAMRKQEERDAKERKRQLKAQRKAEREAARGYD
jgi:uncharacterized protein YceK